MTTPHTHAPDGEDLMRPGGSAQPRASVPYVDRDTHARRCKAKTRAGTQCRSFAVEGMSVCRMHGGASPQAREAARRRKVEAEATALLEVIWDPSSPPVKDPVAGMQRLAGIVTRATDVLGARLEGDSLDGPTAMAWSRVLREQRQVLEAMERLGIAQRHVEVDGAKVQLIAQALCAVFDALGLNTGQRALGSRVLMSHLRAAQGGPVVVGEVGE